MCAFRLSVVISAPQKHFDRLSVVWVGILQPASHMEEFYRQEYCGCVYSLRDTNQHRRSQGRPPIALGTRFYREGDGT
jgi:hypothetical protein